MMNTLPSELLLVIGEHMDSSSLHALILCSRYHRDVLTVTLYEQALREAQERPMPEHDSWTGDLGGPLEADPAWPLHWICSHGHERPLRLVLEQLASRDWLRLQWRDDHYCTALYYAAAQGRTSVVARLLDALAIDGDGGYHAAFAIRPHFRGRTVLSVAAGAGQYDVVRLLLDVWHTAAEKEGADVSMLLRDCPDDDGYAPLTHACKNGEAAMVQLLLVGGGTDRYGLALRNGLWTSAFYVGLSPIFLAVAGDHVNVARVLIAHGTADVDLPAHSGRAPLLVAAERGNAEMVRTLLGSGLVDVNRQDGHGRTALMHVARTGPLSVVSALLEHRARIDFGLRDTTGRTAAQRARPHREIVRMIRAAAAQAAADRLAEAASAAGGAQ